MNTASIQTLLSSSAFGVLPVTIIEHSSVSAQSQPESGVRDGAPASPPCN